MTTNRHLIFRLTSDRQSFKYYLCLLVPSLCGVEMTKDKKDPTLALLLGLFLSFWCYLYLGNVKKFFIMLVIEGFVFLSIFILIGFVLLPLYHIFIAYDCYKSAQGEPVIKI